MTITITLGAFILLGVILILAGLMKLIPAFNTPTVVLILAILEIIDGILFIIGRGG
jgi:hypothetical protein